MPVDVSSEIIIERLPGIVFTYVCDPANAPLWHSNIKSTQWLSEPLVASGSRVAVVGEFLGRTFEYTYELAEVVPGEKLVMRSVDGPFPMEMVCTFEETREGQTRMMLRNHVEPAGMSKLMTPMLMTAVRNATEKDLARLKEILEGHPPQP